MPSTKPRGHKGGAHCGSKGVAREFEKLTVSKRDSPVRHPSRNRTIRPGQLQKLTQARQMGNRAQFKPGIGDNSMGFPKSAWQDKRPSANLNAHSGQTTARDGSRDGHRPRPYFAPGAGAIKSTQMAPPVDRPKAGRSAGAAAHRTGGFGRAAPLEVVTRAPTFVPFQTVQTFQQPPSRGPSPPPPIRQELPPRSSFQNDEAQRQALEMLRGDEASQDSWTQGSQESSTPHYNCTPDDNNPIIAAKPPPPPSPKSHHRSSISRYTGPAQDTSDSEDEGFEATDAVDGTGSATNSSEQEMGSAFDMSRGDSADPQSPVFQISSVSLATVNGGGGLHIPSSTPTPDGRAAVEDESVTMSVTEPTEKVASAPPVRADTQVTVKSESTQTERRPARANVNRWCPHVVSERQKRPGSRSVAGETHDQASEYEWIEGLGEGSSGEVAKVRKHIDGWVYAMKKSKKRVVTKAERERALQEVFVLVAIQSPFIVRYYHSFIQDSHLHILMEYCEGESLDRLVAQQRPCCEHYLLCLLWDISRALVHLHDRPGRPMVHLDIKPENIFSVNSLSPYEDTGAQGTADAIANMDAMVMAEDSQQGPSSVENPPQSPWGQKVAGVVGPAVAQSPAYPKPHRTADAGASTALARLDPMEPRFKLGDCGLVRSADPQIGDDVEEGDRRYLSSEFLEEKYDMLPKADIFALGITLYELASGRPLPDGGQRLRDLRDGKLEDLPHLSNAFKGLIRKMMHPDPQERPAAASLASMAEKELLAKAAEAPSAFSRVPRKSGPFSPLESPLAPGGAGGLPSPIGACMETSGASPSGGTLREQQLERQAQELEGELSRYKQQLADAKAQIARLTSGDGDGNEPDDVASPVMSSIRAGRGMCHDDDDAGENDEKRQLDFAGAASSPNSSFNSFADMSQEL